MSNPSIFVFAVAVAASGCAETAAESGNLRHGYIEVMQTGEALARFGGIPPHALRTEGACVYKHDSTFSFPDYRKHAGVVRVTAAGEPVQLAPDYKGVYREAQRRSTLLWEAGGPVVVEAPGRDAPPFRLEMQGPPAIEPIDPPREDANRLERRISLLHDLPVRWRGGAGAIVFVELRHPSGRRVRCEVDGAAESVVIPQSLLADLPTGRIDLFVGTVAKANVRIGSWSIDAFLYSDAVVAPAVLDTENPPSASNP